MDPTKPRLCNDNRFLNLWVKDTPFNLDSISSLQPRYVSPSSFKSVCDDKSGYDHVTLSRSVGNSLPSFILLFLPCTIFAVRLFLVLCTQTIATQESFNYLYWLLHMRFLPQIMLVLLPWPPRLASLFVSLLWFWVIIFIWRSLFLFPVR